MKRIIQSVVQYLAVICLAVGLAGFGAANAAGPGLQAAPQVNINQAGAEELAEALNGVGMSRAEAIVESRNTDGPFQSADELSRVKGIGPATVDKNRQRIELD